MDGHPFFPGERTQVDAIVIEEINQSETFQKKNEYSRKNNAFSSTSTLTCPKRIDSSV